MIRDFKEDLLEVALMSPTVQNGVNNFLFLDTVKSCVIRDENFTIEKFIDVIKSKRPCLTRCRNTEETVFGMCSNTVLSV